MANISDATGTIQFNPDFYHQNEDVINAFVQDAIEKDNLISEYGITILNQNGETLEFEGSGRWALNNSLDTLLVPLNLDTDNVTKKIFFELFKLLQKQSKSVIEVDYDEYECGCEILAHTTAKISALDPIIPAKKGVRDTKYFESDITDEFDYTYSDYKKIKLEFEDGYRLNDPKQKNYFTNVIFEPWYKKQSLAYKQANPKNELIKKILNTLKTNTDYENGICMWRLEDDYNEFFENLDA